MSDSGASDRKIKGENSTLSTNLSWAGLVDKYLSGKFGKVAFFGALFVFAWSFAYQFDLGKKAGVLLDRKIESYDGVDALKKQIDSLKLELIKELRGYELSESGFTLEKDALTRDRDALRSRNERLEEIIPTFEAGKAALNEALKDAASLRTELVDLSLKYDGSQSEVQRLQQKLAQTAVIDASESENALAAARLRSDLEDLRAEADKSQSEVQRLQQKLVELAAARETRLLDGLRIKVWYIRETENIARSIEYRLGAAGAIVTIVMPFRNHPPANTIRGHSGNTEYVAQVSAAISNIVELQTLKFADFSDADVRIWLYKKE